MAQHTSQAEEDQRKQSNVESLVRAIPHMSKTIVDDTLYEKVLTILTTFLDDNAQTHCALLDQWNVLDILLEACQQPDQDYRVISLCLRLLGKWLSVSDSNEANGDDPLFSKLQSQYTPLLTMMVSGLRTLEPALRCASLEACQGLIHVPAGVSWLLKEPDVKSLISLSLMDESIYVVAQGCRFYLSLIEQENKSALWEELCEYMDPSVQIKHFLAQHHHSSLLLTALEFCWTFANSTCPSVFRYLSRTHLLVTLPDLLILDNRIIRKRVMEILWVLFRHSPSPIELLVDGSTPDGNVMEKSYAFIQNIYSDMIIHHPLSIDHLCTGVELLQISLQILSRLEHEKKVSTPILPLFSVTSDVMRVNDLLMAILYLCNSEEEEDSMAELEKIVVLLRKANRPIMAKLKILQVVMKALHSMVETFPTETKNGDILEATLNMLSNPSFADDQRLLKTCLQLVITSLRYQANLVSSVELQPSFFKFMSLLIHKMDDERLNSRNLILILSTLDGLLGHKPFEVYLLKPETARLLMHTVKIKFVDVEWDVRDAVIEFVGGLFEPNAVDAIMKTKIEFALSLDLPLLVLERIKDQEPYVRASALKTVQAMMKTNAGWLFIQQHERLRLLSKTLPRLLYDTEAFVRRATLDAMGCLVAHRSCEGLLLTQSSDQVSMDEQNILSSDTLAMLMNDDDIEVRIRMCRLLEKFWQLKIHKTNQFKRHTDSIKPSSLSYFYLLQGDHWLLEAVADSQRLVRLEALKVIEQILRTNISFTETEMTAGGKRVREDLIGNTSNTRCDLVNEEDVKDARFIEQLTSLDLVHIKRTTNPEDLYQEVFEISPAMMTQLTDPTDDAHLLDCY